MAVEIERKFLVTDPSVVEHSILPRSEIRQAYLAAGAVSVRVRTVDARGRLTVKGPTRGIRRAEFEYDIPLREAEEMMASLRQGEIIEKIRYRIEEDGFLWEVDVFGGANAPLVLAEVELDDEGVAVPKPRWLGEEVSDDPRFSNASLALHPFAAWGAGT